MSQRDDARIKEPSIRSRISDHPGVLVCVGWGGGVVDATLRTTATVQSYIDYL